MATPWLLYATSSITLTPGSIVVNDPNSGQVTHYTLAAATTFTGSLRVAQMGDSTSETLYDTYASCIPTGGSVNATFASNIATKTFTFTTTGSGSLLMFSLPHHQDNLVSPTYVNLTFLTLRGIVKGTVGTTWTMSEALTTMTWQAPTGHRSDQDEYDPDGAQYR
ncbi:MAG: hypothetical protein WDN27_00915 [Candidatus Saccharibacteria bacterium]